MISQEELEELQGRHICFKCVGDDYLSREIQTRGETTTCSYCGDNDRCFDLEEMADRVARAFEEHYQRTATEPDAFQSAMQRDKESDYEWDREGEPIDELIAYHASMSGTAPIDIRTILEERFSDWDTVINGGETEFDSESRYEPKTIRGGRWQQEWDAFERTLRTETRFFSREATRHLYELFAGLDRIAAGRSGAVLVDGGPSTEIAGLYRARSFPRYRDIHDALARPDLHLGPPPSEAARAGRMNARGISVFYGATDRLTAIAEVRPPVGCNVAVARFSIVRPIKLLDLNALREAVSLGSIFDPGHIDRMQRAAFLRALSDHITVPVMPDDEELGYLVTQAVADFLATTNEPTVDGIIFPSVQTKGDARNVVIFHKSARVRVIDLPAGTSIEVRDGYGTEDGWEQEYSVYEKAPDVPSESTAGAVVPLDFDSPLPNRDTDQRQHTLAVDTQSVEVHAVEAVQYLTHGSKVSRYRQKNLDLPF